MENQCSWDYYFHGKNMEEELRHSLIVTTLELENTKIAVENELKKRDEQIFQLKAMLEIAIRERDEAQSLLYEKLYAISTIQDEPRRAIGSNNGFSSSDCEESIVSSPLATTKLLPDKPLPEKGKLLQAVMQAGPLLQTLLLSGQLPEWRHPPPPLESSEIPPVAISSPVQPPQEQLLQQACGRVSRKRVIFEDSEYPIATKYQAVLH